MREVGVRMKTDRIVIPVSVGYADALIANGVQMRERLDVETVRRYAEILLSPDAAPLPEAVAFCDDISPASIARLTAEDLIVGDGFHRIAAAKLAYELAGGDEQNELVDIWIELRVGTRRDATLHSCSANISHGLRPTRADMRRAVETMISDAEWARWSDREIGRRCGCDGKTVASARKRLGLVQEERIYTSGGEERTRIVRQPAMAPVTASAPDAEFPHQDEPVINDEIPALTTSPSRDTSLPPFYPETATPGPWPQTGFTAPHVSEPSRLTGPPPMPEARCSGCGEIALECTCPAGLVDGLGIGESEIESLENLERSLSYDDSPAAGELGDNLYDVDDPYEPHRRAAAQAPSAPRKVTLKAIIQDESVLFAHARHLLRRWVWTHGSRDGLMRVDRLAELPYDLGEPDDGKPYEWTDQDSGLSSLLRLGLLVTSGAEYVKAKLSVVESYEEVIPSMRFSPGRQDEWVQRRVDDIAEDLNALKVLLKRPLPQQRCQRGCPHIIIEIELVDGVMLSASAVCSSDVAGQAFEPALGRLEEAVVMIQSAKWGGGR